MPKAKKAPQKAAKAPEEAKAETVAPFKMSGATGLTIPEDKAQAIAAAHMAGVPVTRICKELGVGYHTVAALIRNRPELLAGARDITANNWRTLAALGTAELVDRLPEMKDQALSVLSAIATEKAELLSGGATSRVEVIAAPAVDEWSDVVEGVVVESVPVSMGIASRTAAPKAQPPWSKCPHRQQAVNNRLVWPPVTLMRWTLCQNLSQPAPLFCRLLLPLLPGRRGLLVRLGQHYPIH